MGTLRFGRMAGLEQQKLIKWFGLSGILLLIAKPDGLHNYSSSKYGLNHCLILINSSCSCACMHFIAHLVLATAPSKATDM